MGVKCDGMLWFPLADCGVIHLWSQLRAGFAVVSPPLYQIGNFSDLTHLSCARVLTVSTGLGLCYLNSKTASVGPT